MPIEKRLIIVTLLEDYETDCDITNMAEIVEKILKDNIPHKVCWNITVTETKTTVNNETLKTPK